MTDYKQKKQNKRRSGFNPVTVAGAVVAAGIAVAGALALSDEKNRKKVKKVLTTIKDQAISYMENIQKQIHDKKEETGEKVKKVVTTTKKS